jgi:hypothetical protein
MGVAASPKKRVLGPFLARREGDPGQGSSPEAWGRTVLFPLDKEPPPVVYYRLVSTSRA